MREKSIGTPPILTSVKVFCLHLSGCPFWDISKPDFWDCNNGKHMTWAHLQETRQKCKQMFPKLNTACISPGGDNSRHGKHTDDRKQAQSTYVHHKQTLNFKAIGWYLDRFSATPATTVTRRTSEGQRITIIVFIRFYVTWKYWDACLLFHLTWITEVFNILKIINMQKISSINKKVWKWNEYIT